MGCWNWGTCLTTLPIRHEALPVFEYSSNQAVTRLLGGLRGEGLLPRVDNKHMDEEYGSGAPGGQGSLSLKETLCRSVQ